jgi:hypothetical protein
MEPIAATKAYFEGAASSAELAEGDTLLGEAFA